MDRVAMLQEILVQNPNDPFARYGLAMELVNKGETERALGEFQQLIASNPNYTPGYQMFAQTLMKAGRVDHARKMLDEGIACAIRTKNQHALAEMEAMLEELR